MYQLILINLNKRPVAIPKQLNLAKAAQGLLLTKW